MNNNGYLSLFGLIFLLPMLFFASNFFLLGNNEQQIEILAAANISAQNCAESGIERTLQELISTPDLYDEVYSDAFTHVLTYKKTLFTGQQVINQQTITTTVYLYFFNYADSIFILSSTAEFGSNGRQISAFIQEKDHKFTILRWDYHDKKI